MWTKNFLMFVWPILLFSLSGVFCSGWKPIVPPMEYYATKPTTCISNCDLKYKGPLLDDEGEGATESQLKSASMNQPISFNQDKNYHQSNKKLDLEVSFFPQEPDKKANHPLSTYQEVYRKTPTSFFSYKTYGGPQKPTKTVYYGDFELAKLKLTDDVKYYKPYKQKVGNHVKVFRPLSLIENEVNVYRPSTGSLFDEQCPLYKISFRQDLYYQYTQYKVHMPELKEFTICLWARFHNHSSDHSLFSYSVKQHREAIYMWASNLNEPGFFSMKIMGQNIFRLNYPIKLYKWFHTCQSWNGNTGEWQVWVNSYRIARGFHNLLVRHRISGGGVAISGQQQRHFGKSHAEIPFHLKGSGGLVGEITMLQMYKIALTAGKAYNDHTHHHSHYTSTTPEPPEIPTEEPSTTTDHPFLENGQLKKHINVLELAEALKKGQIETPDNYPSFEQFYHHGSQISPVTVHGNTISFVALPGHAIFKRNDESTAQQSESQAAGKDQSSSDQKNNSEKIKHISSRQIQVEKIKFLVKKGAAKNESQNSENPENPEMLQNPESTDYVTMEDLMKNHTEVFEDVDQTEPNSGFRTGKRLRRQNPQSSFRIIVHRPKKLGEIKPSRYSLNRYTKRENLRKNIFEKTEKEASKRHTIFEDPFISYGVGPLISQDVYSSGGFQYGGFSYESSLPFGKDYSDINDEDSDYNFDINKTKKDLPKEIELAEGEVRRIMQLCAGCFLDPFRKVAVISWRDTPKNLFSGALFIKAKSECGNF